ncbi:MAG: hypothetical protein P8Y47_04870 [Alphaproteobacteria bacterium]
MTEVKKRVISRKPKTEASAPLCPTSVEKRDAKALDTTTRDTSVEKRATKPADKVPSAVDIEREKHCAPIEIAYADDGKTMLNAKGGLIDFVRYFWDEVEPGRNYKEGWAIWSVCLHLEACFERRMTRLAINISPGSMKSLLTAVFFPAWVWATRDPTMRFISFSYASHLTHRDNVRFRNLIQSKRFQEMYGDKFELEEKGKIKVSNNKTGWKFASSVGGVGTGERGDCLLIDDAHNVAEADSKVILETAREWFIQAVQNRLNDMEESIIIGIGQRVHDKDIFGIIREKGFEYEHLVIPCEYEPDRHSVTSIWEDPRTVEGECFFPERFPPAVVADLKRLGPVVWATQYQQRPGLDEDAMLPSKSWVPWKERKYPKFTDVIATVDVHLDGLTSCTIWGVFKNKTMLVYAWQKELKLKGADNPQMKHESDADYRARTQDGWGLIEQLNDDCKRFKVKRLMMYVENGMDASMWEFRRSARVDASISIMNAADASAEKYRVFAVQHMLADGNIVCPVTTYAKAVQDACAIYPYGEHAGYVVSSCRAWDWFRKRGVIRRKTEIDEEIRRRKTYKRRAPALYPV